MTLLFVLTALLYEKWAKPLAKNIVCLLLIAVAINNSILANIGYFYMHLSYEHTYADAIELVSDIRKVSDEENFEKITIIGDRIDDVQQTLTDPDTGEKTPAGRAKVLSSLIEESLILDEEHTLMFLKNNFNLDFDVATDSKRKNCSTPMNLKI